MELELRVVVEDVDSHHGEHRGKRRDQSWDQVTGDDESPE
jgi:hypothetical protein